jgi:two-component system nitrogen regulation sensor histidine kinase NtrY
VTAKPSALFQSVFLVAALVVLMATFFAISGIGPIGPSSTFMIWLLGANGVLIAVLAWLVWQRYRALRIGRGDVPGNRMAKRFAVFFGLAAMLPASLVALFLGLTVARGLDYWFSETVRVAVEETAQIARENLDQVVATLEGRVALLAGDLEQEGASAALTGAPQLYRNYLRQQALLREFDAVDVIAADGRSLAGSREGGTVPALAPEDKAEADAGGVALRLFETSGMAQAVRKLNNYGGAYVVVTVDSFAPATLARLRRAEAAILDYRQTQQRSGRIGAVFALGYGQIAVLILLLSVWLGLDAAARVTEPIGRLAQAAGAVREGNLDVRVPVPAGEDEMSQLARSFNDMTRRLKGQRGEIETARQDAEDRRALLEALLGDVNAGVIATDADMTVTIANPAAHALLGVDGAQLTGRPLAELAPEFLPGARLALETGETQDVSLEMERQGEPRHVRVKSSPDRAGGTVLTFDDTTRVVMAQRHLAWRDVARRIAHEIRNPLTPIQLSAERLSRRYRALAGPDDTTFDRCTETILRQVADIGRLVEEFSNFARMPKPAMERFDMRALADKVTYAQRMVTPDLRIEVRGGDAPGGLAVNGDERLLGQALSNLVRNAAQAIAQGEAAAEGDGHITVSLEPAGEHLLLAVEDNGPGFPVEDRARLLDPYVTRREGGTGLGLAIVARIVADHGGSLSLRDRAGGRRGARVEVLLPFDTDRQGRADRPPDYPQTEGVA